MTGKTPKRPRDANQLAKRIVELATESSEERHEDSDAAVLGRAGGQKGGKARARALTPEERSAIAKKAARARWEENDKKG